MIARQRGAPPRPNRHHLRRFFSRVHVNERGCWEWTRGLAGSGYASMMVSGYLTTAHRLAYFWFVGPVAQPDVVDHLCRNARCVNPAHLEAVSQSVNVKRGLAGGARVRCKNGHLKFPDNWYWQTVHGGRVRGCLTCLQTRNERRLLRRIAGNIAAGMAEYIRHNEEARPFDPVCYAEDREAIAHAAVDLARRIVARLADQRRIEDAAPALLVALRELRQSANRLCDRQLGGTYEDDCRRAIAQADCALRQAEAAR